MELDKTDFRWNGKLSGAVNNLYYDLINVDVAHTPYSSEHRNSSFFFKTRLGYVIHENWDIEVGYEVLDVHIIWDDTCNEKDGTVYIMCKNEGIRYIYSAKIEGGLVSSKFKMIEELKGMLECPFDKLFSTNYVRGRLGSNDDFLDTIDSSKPETSENSGIQMNKYILGTTVGLFSDMNVESGNSEFVGEITKPGNYLLVYYSTEQSKSGFAGQVRLITGVDSSSGVKRIMVDSPWLGFRTPKTSEYEEEDEEEKIVQGNGLQYAVFEDWGEVVGYASSHELYILTDNKETNKVESMSVYNQSGSSHTHIIGVADANDKIFVLTKNGYVHYSSAGIGHNKMFIQDDMYAGTDKISIAAYKDIVLAFGRRHIAVGVPDEANNYWTMYNQSATIGLWSRYAFTEYDGDLLFVSNDKRLLALGIAQNTGRYMLQHEDVGAMLNSKLETMLDNDEVFLGADGNDLRIFIQTQKIPYYPSRDIHAKQSTGGNNMTHIHKFNKKFKVWTEDHLDGFLLTGVEFGIYYGEGGLYVRNTYGDQWGVDWGKGGATEFETKISAYLIENENTGMDGQPNLFMLAKLNRLITTLGQGKYSDNTKIHVLSYRQGIGVNLEFPIGTSDETVLNRRIEDISRVYSADAMDKIEISDCQKEAIQDMEKGFEKHCTGSVYSQSLVNTMPWFDNYKELLAQDHSICINDRIYKFAPTMPLVTSLGQNQNYSTQIKLELTSKGGDCVNFGGWLAELFIAPLGLTGPDGEYLLPLETGCE